MISQFRISADGRVLMPSRTFMRRMGLSGTEIPIQHCFDLIDLRDRDRSVRELHDGLRSGRAFWRAFRFTAVDGVPHAVRTHTYPVQVDGKLSAWVGRSWIGPEREYPGGGRIYVGPFRRAAKDASQPASQPASAIVVPG